MGVFAGMKSIIAGLTFALLISLAPVEAHAGWIKDRDYHGYHGKSHSYDGWKKGAYHFKSKWGEKLKKIYKYKKYKYDHYKPKHKVPEASTGALLAAGVIGLGVLRRRRSYAS